MAKTYEIKECLHCKKEFEAKRNGQQCCCIDCFLAWCKSVAQRKEVNNG